MADIRINALAGTATSSASDDYLAIDGAANGTRKLSAYSPTFGGNLTVSGTGTSSVAGNFLIGQGTAVTSGARNYLTIGGTLLGSIALKDSSDAGAAYFQVTTTGAELFSNTGKVLVLGSNGGEQARFATSGNLLLGTTTDSSNGKLQLATHTTSAGGIGFGTDVSLYRFNTGQVVLDGTTGNSAVMWFAESGTRKGYLQSNAGNLNIYSTGGSVVLASNNTTALTLDSSQNATISGNATVNGASGITTTATNGFGLLHSAAASTFRGMKLQTSGSNRWLIAANNTAESGSNAGSDFVIYGYNDAGGFLNESLRITRSTGALTVGGTLIVSTSSTPASASATGTTGTIAWDSSYIYVCTATNTWKRVAIATW